MLSALHTKLLRDLARSLGQVATIALVIACGIASFVALRANYGSIQAARSEFYERQRFADVFAELERAPESVRERLERLPNVTRVQTRVVEAAVVPLGRGEQPARARVVSLESEPEALNAIQVREGRRPEPGRASEAVLLQGFADAHGLGPGDPLEVVMNGKQRELRIVGIASSPEYVIAVGSGALSPDPERFAVLFARPSVREP